LGWPITQNWPGWQVDGKFELKIFLLFSGTVYKSNTFMVSSYKPCRNKVTLKKIIAVLPACGSAQRYQQWPTITEVQSAVVVSTALLDRYTVEGSLACGGCIV